MGALPDPSRKPWTREAPACYTLMLGPGCLRAPAGCVADLMQIPDPFFSTCPKHNPSPLVSFFNGKQQKARTRTHWCRLSRQHGSYAHAGTGSACQVAMYVCMGMNGVPHQF